MNSREEAGLRTAVKIFRFYKFVALGGAVLALVLVVITLAWGVRGEALRPAIAVVICSLSYWGLDHQERRTRRRLEGAS
jgi:hypothetical protein